MTLTSFTVPNAVSNPVCAKRQGVFMVGCLTSMISRQCPETPIAPYAELNPGQERNAWHASAQHPPTISKYYLKIPIAPDAELNPGYGPNVYLTGWGFHIINLHYIPKRPTASDAELNPVRELNVSVPRICTISFKITHHHLHQIISPY